MMDDILFFFCQRQESTTLPEVFCGRKMLTRRHPSGFVSQIKSFKWSLNEGIRWPGCQILTVAIDVTCW